MTKETVALNNQRPRAVLVGVQLPDTDAAHFDASLAELTRLVDTLGFDVVGRVTQKRTHLSSSAGLGAGKLLDLARYTGGTGVVPSGAQKKVQRKEFHAPGAEPVDAADFDDEVDESAEPPVVEDVPRATVVVVDNELSPSQMRNLERASGVEVLDRTGVIIEIFWRHARTKEAQLQVEIARLQYEAPRLREKEHSNDRQRGGGVGGRGDDDLEMDRRRIRDRIAELRRQLEDQQDEGQERIKRRKDALRMALVGYTNAGKSSLMRALTGSEVLVADKLFATLGTTVRALHPETHPRVLVSDTVGFIKNLPHSLVASFRSTLDEAHEASLLLFVVDASDPAFRDQLTVTQEVLGEIGARDADAFLVLNKIDRVAPADRKKLQREFSGKRLTERGFLAAIQVSALDPTDVASLRDRIVTQFERAMAEESLVVPYDRQQAIGAIREQARVVKEEWDQDGAHFVLRAPKANLDRLRTLVAR